MAPAVRAGDGARAEKQPNAAVHRQRLIARRYKNR